MSSNNNRRLKKSKKRSMPEGLKDSLKSRPFEKTRQPILLVGEAEENYMFHAVKEILAAEGYKIISAFNTADAISVLRSGEMVDMIIADIFLPGANGFEFYREAIGIDNVKEKPFIVITASSTIEDILRGFLLGADDYIVKPFDPHLLLKRVKEMFEDWKVNRKGIDTMAIPLSGIFHGMQSIEILRILEAKNVKGLLSIKGDDGKDGDIFVDKGHLLYARGGGEFGFPGLMNILKLQKGTYNFTPGPSLVSANIGESITKVILDALRNMTGEVREGIRIQKKTNINKEVAMEKAMDLNGPVEIGKDTYWVGYRNPNTIFQLSPYLRVFKGASGSINLLIDPGSPVDFLIVTKKVGRIIGSIANVHIASINHPDPDVALGAAYIEKINPKLMVLTTLDNWRLVANYDMKASNFRDIGESKGRIVRLSTGHAIRAVPTPHCHFRGAFAIYDTETRILFTGDLMGGITGNDITNLYAAEKDWDGIKAFHQIYMPSSKAIQRAIERIRGLDPKPVLIAPQHGMIIKDDLIEEFMERLYNLPVGMDAIPEDENTDAITKSLYTRIANEMLHAAASLIGEEEALERLTSPADDGLDKLVTIEGGQIRSVQSNPQGVAEIMLSRLTKGESAENIDLIGSAVVKICYNHHIPPPSMKWKTGDNEQEGILIAD